MPYAWSSPADATRVLTLRPHRSLSPSGFARFIAATATFLALPLLTLLGSPAVWAILPFAILAVAGVWTAIRRNWRAAGEVGETLTLAPGKTELVRSDPAGERRWTDNPYWVRVRAYATGGPVPYYLTLRGTGREVEIGAFLSEPERAALKGEIETALAALR
ncbi:MAG: DUF2244 domain-containing protein [Paracoccaceae bacterium]